MDSLVILLSSQGADDNHRNLINNSMIEFTKNYIFNKDIKIILLF